LQYEIILQYPVVFTEIRILCMSAYSRSIWDSC